MRKFFNSLLMTGMLIAIASCSKSESPADARMLLGNIPAQAAAVAVIDIEKTLSHSGISLTGTSVIKSDEVKKIIASSGSFGDLIKLMDGESTLRFTSAVVFEYAGNGYSLACCEDPEKLRTFIESDTTLNPGHEKWTQDGEFYNLGRFQVAGNIICTASNPSLITHARKFHNISEAQSILSDSNVAKLADCEHDISWWGDLERLVSSSSLSFSDRTSLRMASGMLFDEPSFISGYGDIDKMTLKTSTEIFDKKGKPAKCQLDLSGINQDVVASLSGNANCIFAFGVSGKLVKQLLKSAGSFGGNMPEMYKNLISPLNGTIAIASPNTIDNNKGGFRAVISTEGNQASLMQFLQNMDYQVKPEDNSLVVERGAYGDGAFSLAETAKEMKSSVMALKMRTGSAPRNTDIFASLEDSNGSLTLRVDITPVGSDKHFLINLISILN